MRLPPAFTGKLHLEIRPLDMTALVLAALDAVRPAIDAKGIAMSVVLDPAAARIIGDPERLQQVVWNLANNAVKLTPKGGSIEVRLECSIVGKDLRTFTTEDARLDDRLRSHPARQSVISYCGVLIRDELGSPYGTLCHFDLAPCDVPLSEMPVMEAVAPQFMRALLARPRAAP